MPDTRLNRSRGRALGLTAQRSNGGQSILTSGTIGLLRAMIEDVVICKSMGEHQALRLQEPHSGAGHFEHDVRTSRQLQLVPASQ